MEDLVMKTIRERIQDAGGYSQLNILDMTGVYIKVIPIQMKKILQACTNLYEISLENCGLESLENLPQMKIQNLILNGNKLKDKDVGQLLVYQDSLKVLSLCQNYIKNLESLQILTKLQQLNQLDLKQNPFCQNAGNYHQVLFHEIFQNNHNLTLIDVFCRNGTILSDSQEQSIEEQTDMMNQVKNQLMKITNPNFAQDSEEEEQSDQQIELNIVEKYAKQIQNDPSIKDKQSFLVNLLNERETINDPLEVAYQQNLKFLGIDEDGEAIDEEEANEEDFREQIKNNEITFKAIKRIKRQYDDDEYDY